MNTCPSRVSVGAVWFVALRFPRGGAHEGGSRAAVLAAATVPEQPQSASSLAKLVYAIDDLCQVVGISRATVYKEIKEHRPGRQDAQFQRPCAQPIMATWIGADVAKHRETGEYANLAGRARRR